VIQKPSMSFRLLLLTNATDAEPLRTLLGGGLLADWEVIKADNYEHVRFLQQWNPCDVVLVDSPQLTGGDHVELVSLPLPRRTPLVVLSDSAAGNPHRRAGQVQEHWLPRKLVLDHPGMLVVVLEQAAQFSQLDRQLRQREHALQDSQRQVNRLVNLLWNTLPTDLPTPWFTQRQMVERLHEEVLRSQRYGDDLSVVVGEVVECPGQPLDSLEPSNLSSWLAGRLGKHKRRSDVAGQYGPQGFLLLLTQTNEQGASQCCRRLRPLLQSSDTLPSGATAAPRIRFGLAGFSASSTTVTSLLARAEESLDQARLQSAACLTN